ncbi:MAG: hypothetical protein JO332_06085 [Planctomycetaceae bacterium]|nr:hypothetical protein [Planctomycetaceae bacterium]
MNPDPHDTTRTAADDLRARLWELVTKRIPEGWEPEVNCGRGWLPIVLKLLRDVDDVWRGFPVEGAPERCWCPVEVKEKFGGLRFYVHVLVPPRKTDPPDRIADVNARTQKMNELIRKAEEACAGLCEDCGNAASGPRWVNNWVRTVCQSCYEHWLEEDVEHLKEVNKAHRNKRSLNTTRMYFNLMDVKERERRGFGGPPLPKSGG